jgi:heterotetrameric sarcosine oxidase gamma subunit
MLEQHSALALRAEFKRNDVRLLEDADFVLTQIAGNKKAVKKSLGKLPAKVGVVLDHDARMLLRIAPKQFWLLGEPIVSGDGVYVTHLSSGRTRIVLDGNNATRLLSAIALIDFSTAAFRPKQFVMTGIHHTPVTILCVAENEFHIFVLRSFAQNVWEWLCDVAEGLQDA